MTPSTNRASAEAVGYVSGRADALACAGTDIVAGVRVAIVACRAGRTEELYATTGCVADEGRTGIACIANGPGLREGPGGGGERRVAHQTRRTRVRLAAREALAADGTHARARVTYTALIHLTIAVVVLAVAELRSVRVDRGIEGVAIGCDEHVTNRLCACLDNPIGFRGAESAVSIPIDIGYPIGRASRGVRTVVNSPVAVIVLAVTQLEHTGMYGRIAVVTVAVGGDVSDRRCAG